MYRSHFAYFTLVSASDNLPGALLLGWSLKKSNTVNDCVAMVVPDISNRDRNLLRKMYDRVIEVEAIKTCQTMRRLRYLGKDERAVYSRRMTKCNVFKFIEYEKVLFVESSSYILRNIDELFELNAPAGISSLVDSQSQSKFHGISLSKDHVTKSLQLSRGIRGHMLLLAPSLSIYHFCLSHKGIYNEMHFIQPDGEFLTKLFQAQWTHIHSKFALIPWQANRIKVEAYGVCLESFHPWKDDCEVSDDIHRWRLKAIKMCRDIPHIKTIFKGMQWFSEMEIVAKIGL